MRGFEASSFIEASPEQVWPVLTDTAAWPRWDSGVTSVEGSPVLGGKITVSIEASPGKAFPLTVAELVAPNRMVLRGGLPLGLFTGRRAYTLVAEGSGTRFTMREEFTGLLAGLIFRTIPDLGPSFRQFVDGLKKQAE